MAQFTAYANPNPATDKQFPYLLDIQSDFLDALKTTVVLPLTPAGPAAAITMTRLNPLVEVYGEPFIVLTQDIAGIDRSSLRTSAFDLGHYRSEITAAIDFMISGI